MTVLGMFDGAAWRPVAVQTSESLPASPDDDPALDGQVWFVVDTATDTVTGMLVSYAGVWNTVPI